MKFSTTLTLFWRMRLFSALLLLVFELCPTSSAPCIDEPGAICNAILKFPKEEDEEEGLVVNQGAYCTCDSTSCVSTWENETLSNVSAFTWHYYAQAYMEIQYKFCRPQPAVERICSPHYQFAAQIISNVTVWNPRKVNHECRCPLSKYFLKSWRMRMDYEWVYQYVCDMKQCEIGQVCAHQYFKPTLITTGFDIMCVCPRHYSCEIEQEANTTDNSMFDIPRGEHYFQRYCYDVAARRAQRYEYLKVGKDAEASTGVTPSARTVRRAARDSDYKDRKPMTYADDSSEES